MATVTLLILCLAWKTRADSSADLISISKRRFQNGGGPSQPITQPITVALSLPSDAANGASSSYSSYYGPTGGDDFLTPTAAPSGSPFLLDPYSASNTNSATMNTVDVDFLVCGGQIATFSLCDSTGTACSASVSGDTYLRLYEGSTQVASNDDVCSLCSEITYTIPGSSSACTTLTLTQGCHSSGVCSGQVQVTFQYPYTPTYTPTIAPTVSPLVPVQGALFAVLDASTCAEDLPYGKALLHNQSTPFVSTYYENTLHESWTQTTTSGYNGTEEMRIRWFFQSGPKV